MSDRRRNAAGWIKTVYEHLRSGKLASIDINRSDAGYDVRLLITDGNFQAKIIINE